MFHLCVVLAGLEIITETRGITTSRHKLKAPSLQKNYELHKISIKNTDFILKEFEEFRRKKTKKLPLPYRLYLLKRQKSRKNETRGNWSISCTLTSNLLLFFWKPSALVFHWTKQCSILGTTVCCWGYMEGSWFISVHMESFRLAKEWVWFCLLNLD